MKKRSVIKRDGSQEEIKLSKIIERVEALSEGLDVQTDIVAQKVIEKVIDGITSKQIDQEIALTAFSMVSEHNHYSYLASKILASSLHKETPGFYQGMKILIKNEVVDKKYEPVIKKIGKKLEKAIQYDRDLTNFDFIGLKTLVDNSYLLRLEKGDSKVIIERPQDMYMRVAIQIHCDFDKKDFGVNEIIEEYNFISQKAGTYATPTLFNSCTKRPQLSSCFLLQTDDDSIEGIYKTMSDTAKISQSSGGVGLAVHNIRSKGSRIVASNGVSNGIVPMLRVFQETARYVDQGGGKRKGSFAIYLEPWHKDIVDFIDCSNKHLPTKACPDLFTAIWANDLFMERVEKDQEWTLFCPNELKKNHNVDLSELYDSPDSKDFSEAYLKLEELGFGTKIMAREIWAKFLEANATSGRPYVVFKDSCNHKSNQKNLGTIKSSNLCAEIIEYISPEEVAVCNLASISLVKYITGEGIEAKVDKEALGKAVKRFTKGLNKIIDINYYPLPEMVKSNKKNRPIGLGVQGLADVFLMCHAPWGSERSRVIQRDIFETIYYYALEASMEVSKVDGAYETFEGSPASRGELQFDFYDHQNDSKMYQFIGKSNDFDWNALKEKIKKHGLRNSLLVACMPTGSTSQMLGNFEGINPFQENIFTRTLLNGEYQVVNRHLIRDLQKLNIWSSSVKNSIIRNGGSVQGIEDIPAHLREIYKTSYEIGNKNLLTLAADRQRFICQSQSMNLFTSDNDGKKLTKAILYAWKTGLKTGKYYLYQKARVQAAIINTEVKESLTDEILSGKNDPNEDLDDCLMCGA
jgi:ribonucleoside-diphosphate reductase alpha chain